MAANFNALPRPGSVLLDQGGARLIKRHETVDDVFARDILE
jgi:diaminopimelate decarboxylase